MLVHSAGALLERCGLAYGPQTAVVYGDRRITYTEQIAGSGRPAGRCSASAWRRATGSPVLMSDRPELLDIFYGTLWAGLAIVPLNAGQRLRPRLHHR